MCPDLTYIQANILKKEALNDTVLELRLKCDCLAEWGSWGSWAPTCPPAGDSSQKRTRECLLKTTGKVGGEKEKGCAFGAHGGEQTKKCVSATTTTTTTTTTTGY